MSLGLVLALSMASSAEDSKPHNASQIGKSFQVPYRLTETNHFLVRVRINGKGPFNFLVDSGAPALYVATETAAKIGLKPPKGANAVSLYTLHLPCQGETRSPEHII